MFVGWSCRPAAGTNISVKCAVTTVRAKRTSAGASTIVQDELHDTYIAAGCLHSETRWHADAIIPVWLTALAWVLQLARLTGQPQWMRWTPRGCPCLQLPSPGCASVLPQPHLPLQSLLRGLWQCQQRPRQSVWTPCAAWTMRQREMRRQRCLRRQVWEWCGTLTLLLCRCQGNERM